MKQPQISRRELAPDSHEVIMELRWFSATGNYLVEAVGLGITPEAAETSAKLHLGQARAKLNEVTAKETV